MSWRRATVILALMVPSCGPDCDLGEEVRDRAGPDAVNCGHVLLGGDRSMADACVLKAFADGKPFHVRYEMQGTDSHVALGVVRSGVGKVFFLLYDGDPGGGGGDGDPWITASVCESPTVHFAPASRPQGTAPFECGSVSPMGRVCG